ncbi:MAG TPA: DinB family protein [Blastocatellia bacterium]|nr:DinB family protein [Blastocatellia bacterium]
MNTDPKRELFRHTVATLAYRGGKAVRGAPESFANFRPSETSRTPAQILAHIGDLLDWALSMARGAEKWQNSEPQSWAEDVERFHTSLSRLDQYLASGEELGTTCERLFQSAIADSLTHVGQLAMLRRIAGDPIKGENYSRADIRSGRVGPEQTKPQFEF